MTFVEKQNPGRVRPVERVVILYLGSFSMNNNVEFQVVCIDCGCVGIRIEDPLKASREGIVYCGDCGASRGTMGALRDLAVQSNTEVKLTTRPRVTFQTGRTADDPQSHGEISKRYGELQRLRQQVKIAESLAREPKRRVTAILRSRRGDATVVP